MEQGRERGRVRESKILVHSSMVQFLVGIRTPLPPFLALLEDRGLRVKSVCKGGKMGLRAEFVLVGKLIASKADRQAD